MSPTIEKRKVVLLTPDRWPALVDLFGDGGPCSRCWCMYWRIGAEYRKRSPVENQSAFHKIVEQGPPPGLIAFQGDLAVGWCQLTRHEDLPWLKNNSRFRAPDGSQVWSISCFYIRKGYRRQGVTAALIEAAIKRAKTAGAQRLEAYPLDAERTPSASGTGYASTFARLGFVEIARPTPPRPIMRYELAK